MRALRTTATILVEARRVADKFQFAAAVGECADETHTCDFSVTRGVVALVG